jgi:prolyl 4-hydroxylase
METVARQPVTNELLTWASVQLRDGHHRALVVKSIVASGWAEESALEAVQRAEQGQGAPRPEAATPSGGEGFPVPRLLGAPLYVDVGDRKVAVLQTMADPRIVVFGDLLANDECDELIRQARPRMARSLTVDMQSGGTQLHDARTSSGMFFQRGETELLRTIEARITKLVAWPLENGEGIQVLRYTPGAEYKPHYDYFDPKEPGSATHLRRGGQRVGTLIMYLGEPEQGGATVFPDVGLEVAPKRGNAVFFSYSRPHADTKSLHGGAPVIAGEKWIATKWLRERRYD